MQTENKYQVTLIVRFDLTTDEELDGEKLAGEIKDVIIGELIPRIKTVGTPGILFDTNVNVQDVGPDDAPDDAPDMGEQTFFLAMADYLERHLLGRQRCNCPTCTKVTAIISNLSETEQRQFIRWLRTREPMTKGNHDPMRLLKLLVAIGISDALSVAYSENQRRPGIGPHFNPAARMN